MIRAAFFIIYITFALCSHADVDLKNGNFFFSWVDSEISTKNFFWQLQRSYNSRVNRVGYFGHGWCSPLESKLKIISPNELSIQNCGSGEITTFTGGMDQWRYQDQIITQVENVYALKVKGVTQLQFNKDGDLEAFFLRDEKAKLKYSQGKLTRLESSAGNLFFQTDDNGKISEIKLDSGKKIIYSYKGDNLISVLNQWGNLFSYEYDQSGNMLLAKWPDKTIIKLTYSNDRDWVTSMVDRDKCKEKYDYKIKKIGKQSQVSSKINRSCGDNQTSVKIAEMIFDPNNQLKKVKQTYRNQWHEIEYADNGKPLRVKNSSGLKSEFEYDTKGNLISKTNGQMSIRYTLNDKYQINQITSGKTNLKLDYDDRGRINKIVSSDSSNDMDFGSDELILSYVDHSEKLKVIELNGQGRIIYSYDSLGQIVDTQIQNGREKNESVQAQINRIYGMYTMLTDESAIYGVPE